MRSRFALIAVAIVTAGGLVLTLAASAKATEAAPRDPGARTQPEAKEVSPKSSKSKIQRTEVCFTVHVIGDPADFQVRGTLFHQKRYRGGGTALLLQHGSVSERSVWDPQVTGMPSMAQQLAEGGFAVFTVDRLGYGQSLYRPEEGAGWVPTMDSYVEMTHEIVTQIREGTYRITDDECPGGAPAEHAAKKVVLMGMSGGAALTELYATRYHDIDGIVPMVYSSHGSSTEFFNEIIVDVAAKQWAQGEDYIYLFWGPGGTPAYSQTCEKFLFYAGGVSEDTIEHVCGPGYFGAAEPRLNPSGELSTAIANGPRIQQDIGNVTTPALLVFADRDAIFPAAYAVADEAMWRAECNCEVDVLWQKRAGHHNMAHDSITETTDSIIAWLRTGELPEPAPANPSKDPVPTPPCPTSEQFPTLGLAGKHEDVSPPVLPGAADYPNYRDESIARYPYRLDVSGSADVPDARLATVRVEVTWDNLTEFDLWVYDSAGKLLSNSENYNAQTGRGSETVLLFDQAHCTDLRIDIVNFAGSPTSIMDLDVTVSDLAATPSRKEGR